MLSTRRSLFKRLLGAVVVVAWPHVARAKKVAVRLDKADKLKKIGGWTILKLKGEQILFIREEADSIRALSPICTHEKCLVAYNPKSKKIECGCHKSSYDLDGKVLDGPAPAPLKTYQAKLSKGRIIITLD